MLGDVAQWLGVDVGTVQAVGIVKPRSPGVEYAEMPHIQCLGASLQARLDFNLAKVTRCIRRIDRYPRYSVLGSNIARSDLQLRSRSLSRNVVAVHPFAHLPPWTIH